MEFKNKFCVHCGEIHIEDYDWCSTKCAADWNRLKNWWDEHGCRIRATQGNPNEKIFDEIDTKEKAYWLGVLHSDGHGIVDRKIAVSQHNKDIELIDNWIKFIGVDPA